MSTPEQDEINALKAEIEGYRSEYEGATDNEEKRELRQLITERGRTLNKLLDAQAAASETAQTGKKTPPNCYIALSLR